MSHQAFNYVIDSSEARGSSRLVIFQLANYADPEEFSGWFTHKVLAKGCLLSEPTVSRALKDLVELGEISYQAGSGRTRSKFKITKKKPLQIDGPKDPDPSTEIEADPSLVTGLTPEALGGHNQLNQLNEELTSADAAEPVKELTELEQRKVDARPNAERLANDIVGRYARASNTKIKPASKSSVDAVVDLLVVDETEVRRVERIIAWLFESDSPDAQFWRTNVRSGAKLRAKFPELVMKANASRKAGNNAPAPRNDRVLEYWELSCSYTENGSLTGTALERCDSREAAMRTRDELRALIEAVERDDDTEARISCVMMREHRDSGGRPIGREELEDCSEVIS